MSEKQFIVVNHLLEVFKGNVEKVLLTVYTIIMSDSNSKKIVLLLLLGVIILIFSSHYSFASLFYALTRSGQQQILNKALLNTPTQSKAGSPTLPNSPAMDLNQKFRSKIFNFSINFPQDWTGWEGKFNQKDYVLLTPANEMPNTLLKIKENFAGSTCLARIIIRQIDHLPSLQNNGTENVKIDNILVGNIPGWRYEVTFVIDGPGFKKGDKTLEFVLKNSEKLFDFESCGTPTEIDLGIFENIVGSVRFMQSENIQP